MEDVLPYFVTLSKAAYNSNILPHLMRIIKQAITHAYIDSREMHAVTTAMPIPEDSRV